MFKKINDMIQVSLIATKNFIEKYWKGFIIIVLLIFAFFLFNKTKSLESKIVNTLEKAKEHEIKANFYKDIYKKLLEEDIALEVKYDSLVIEKNKVKILYNEKIKLVDKYSVSDMQQYFNERTK
jgi:hypothetical protein